MFLLHHITDSKAGTPLRAWFSKYENEIPSFVWGEWLQINSEVDNSGISKKKFLRARQREIVLLRAFISKSASTQGNFRYLDIELEKKTNMALQAISGMLKSLETSGESQSEPETLGYPSACTQTPSLVRAGLVFSTESDQNNKEQANNIQHAIKILDDPHAHDTQATADALWLVEKDMVSMLISDLTQDGDFNKAANDKRVHGIMLFTGVSKLLTAKNTPDSPLNTFHKAVYLQRRINQEYELKQTPTVSVVDALNAIGKMKTGDGFFRMALSMGYMFATQQSVMDDKYINLKTSENILQRFARDEFAELTDNKMPPQCIYPIPIQIKTPPAPQGDHTCSATLMRAKDHVKTCSAVLKDMIVNAQLNIAIAAEFPVSTSVGISPPTPCDSETRSESITVYNALRSLHNNVFTKEMAADIVGFTLLLQREPQSEEQLCSDPKIFTKPSTSRRHNARDLVQALVSKDIMPDKEYRFACWRADSATCMGKAGVHQALVTGGTGQISHRVDARPDYCVDVDLNYPYNKGAVDKMAQVAQEVFDSDGLGRAVTAVVTVEGGGFVRENARYILDGNKRELRTLQQENADIQAKLAAKYIAPSELVASITDTLNVAAGNKAEEVTVQVVQSDANTADLLLRRDKNLAATRSILRQASQIEEARDLHHTKLLLDFAGCWKTQQYFDEEGNVAAMDDVPFSDRSYVQRHVRLQQSFPELVQSFHANPTAWLVAISKSLAQTHTQTHPLIAPHAEAHTGTRVDAPVEKHSEIAPPHTDTDNTHNVNTFLARVSAKLKYFNDDELLTILRSNLPDVKDEVRTLLTKLERTSATVSVQDTQSTLGYGLWQDELTPYDSEVQKKADIVTNRALLTIMTQEAIAAIELDVDCTGVDGANSILHTLPPAPDRNEGEQSSALEFHQTPLTGPVSPTLDGMSMLPDEKSASSKMVVTKNSRSGFVDFKPQLPHYPGAPDHPADNRMPASSSVIQQPAVDGRGIYFDGIGAPAHSLFHHVDSASLAQLTEQLHKAPHDASDPQRHTILVHLAHIFQNHEKFSKEVKYLLATTPQYILKEIVGLTKITPDMQTLMQGDAANFVISMNATRLEEQAQTQQNLAAWESFLQWLEMICKEFDKYTDSSRHLGNLRIYLNTIFTRMWRDPYFAIFLRVLGAVLLGLLYVMLKEGWKYAKHLLVVLCLVLAAIAHDSNMRFLPFHNDGTFAHALVFFSTTALLTHSPYIGKCAAKLVLTIVQKSIKMITMQGAGMLLTVMQSGPGTVYVPLTPDKCLLLDACNTSQLCIQYLQKMCASTESDMIKQNVSQVTPLHLHIPLPHRRTSNTHTSYIQQILKDQNDVATNKDNALIRIVETILNNSTLRDVPSLVQNLHTNSIQILINLAWTHMHSENFENDIEAIMAQIGVHRSVEGLQAMHVYDLFRVVMQQEKQSDKILQATTHVGHLIGLQQRDTHNEARFLTDSARKLLADTRKYDKGNDIWCTELDNVCRNIVFSFMIPAVSDAFDILLSGESDNTQGMHVIIPKHILLRNYLKAVLHRKQMCGNMVQVAPGFNKVRGDSLDVY